MAMGGGSWAVGILLAAGFGFLLGAINAALIHYCRIISIVVTIAMEALRFLDGPLDLGFMTTTGVPGLRMVFFSALLMIVVIYRQQGLMGKAEFSWDALSRIGLLPKRGASGNKEGK